MEGKKLFQLRNKQTGQLSKETFADKMAAKQERRERNGMAEGKEIMTWVVTPGPEHHSVRKQ